MALERERYMILNGELCTEQFSDTPYLYQNIHSLGHRPLRLAQHIAQLSDSIQELFGLKPHISTSDIEQQIADLLAANRLPRNHSIRVELRWEVGGDISLYCDEASLYTGYVLRPLRPQALCLPTNMPLSQHTTSASRATRDAADAIARAKGFGKAIIVESDGGIAVEPASPLTIIKEHRLFLPEGCQSIESSTAEQAARLAGLDIIRRRLTIADLKEADEVLIFDWQGITALSQIFTRPLMDLVATRLAKAAATIVK